MADDGVKLSSKTEKTFAELVALGGVKVPVLKKDVNFYQLPIEALQAVDVSDNQNIWYLDTVNGLDTNSGRSRSAPKKTGDAVVIACKTAGKTTGRLVVMAGSNGVVFNATTWSNTAFPFFDVVVESFFSTIEFNSAMPTDLNFRGGIVTFNLCQIGGDSCIDARKIELNGGGCYSLYDSQIILRGSESIKTNGFIAQNTTFESPLLTIDALGLKNRCNIHCGKINGTGTIFNSNNEVLFLDLCAALFAFEGEFQFPSQVDNSWIKITAAKMARTATTRLLYLGAVAGVTVNYQLVVDTMGSIVPLEIANPAGTVAGKVIELLKYENKVDAEIIRATAAEALKADLIDGFVPSSQLHGYVDDVLDAYVVGSTPFASDWLSLTVGGTALTPESGKIYIVLTAGVYEMLEFRWSGTVYGEISKSIALGETSSTAYRGDRGKTAYDHSLLTSGNPHGVTKSDVGLGDVDNVSDANKPVSTATQTALDLKANKLTTVNNSTDTAYTFLASDANTCHIVNTSTSTTRTVPSDTTAPDIAIGDSIEVQNLGTGVVTFVAASGVTIRSSLTLVMYGQYSVCMLRKIAANTWVLTGERTAV